MWKTPAWSNSSLIRAAFVPAIKDGGLFSSNRWRLISHLAKKYGRGRMGVETLEGEALASQWSFWARITRLGVCHSSR